MDFKELWGKADTPDIPPPDRAELEAMLGKESQGLLVKLKQQLRHKLVWGLGINIPTTILIVLLRDNLPSLILLGIILLMSAILMAVIYRYYRRLPNHLDMGQGMLPLMKTYNDLVRKALRFEERAGAFFVIPSPAMGALLSMVADGQRSVEEVLADPAMLIVLGVATVLVAPPAVWLTVWMNRYAFGKYLDKLQKNIDSLEAS
jgi:hypothetical protein